MRNTLYFGDNLEVLRKHVPDETVDLIYLDPPFNSKRDYNVIFKEATGALPASQMHAFDDSWHWTEETARTLDALKQSPHFEIANLIEQFQKVLGSHNDVTAYLVMMAPRLIELYRVLKNGGSIYLHCDQTADSYLRVLMDTVFGAKCYQNQVIWSYRRWPSPTSHYQRMHDVLLFYGKGSSHPGVFNVEYEPNSPSYEKRFKGHTQKLDPETKTRKIELEEASKGLPQRDVWEISIIAGSSKERLGYATQKPEALLERIINTSSNEGDIILDPFCGCGTAVAVAQRLKRQWIGIDVTYLAINLIEYRLKGHNLVKERDYQVVGEPKDAASALSLAQADKWQFQFWATAFIGAFPVGGEKKKGSDKGIDGLIPFVDGADKHIERIIVQVKGGGTSVKDMRDLRGVVEREKAAMGFLICAAQPTKDMLQEAAQAGMCQTESWGGFPRLQIRTVDQLFAGQGFEHPHAAVSGLKAAPKAAQDDEQTELNL